MTLLSDRSANNEANTRKEEDRCTTNKYLLSIQEENDHEHHNTFSSPNLTSRQRHMKDLLIKTKEGDGMESCNDMKLLSIVSPLQQLLLSADEAPAPILKLLGSSVGRILASNMACTEEFHCTAAKNEKQMEQACHAAFSGNTGLLHELLTRNSELVKMRWCGLTLIHMAAFGGHVENVHVLISAGADVSSTMEQCKWPGESLGQDEMKKIEIMVPDHDSLSWIVNCDYVSPLMLAVSQNHVRVVELLIDSGADCNQSSKDQKFISPIFYAVNKGFIELVHLLLNRGSRADLQGDWKRQTLMHVVKHSQLAKLLIDRGLSVDTVDKNGCTPLHYAAARHDIEVYVLLLYIKTLFCFNFAG